MGTEHTGGGFGMDAAQKVDNFISGRFFSSESVKQKTRAALLRDLRTIEEIGAYRDDVPEESLYNRYDDGVKTKTFAEIDSEQKSKRQSIQQREVFDDNELITVTAVINHKLKWGYTLLHFAAVAGDEAECLRLIGLGASKTAMDNGHKMPWQKAQSSDHHALAILLKP